MTDCEQVASPTLQEYQIVMHGSVHGDADVGGKYLDIFTMEDVSISPNVAIERGEASLVNFPEKRAIAANAPRWRVPDGFKIERGTNGVFQPVQGEDRFLFSFTGDGNYKIRGSAIVRIILWPLSIWALASTCTATCYPSDVRFYVCGPVPSCSGSPVVLNSNNNVIKMALPAEMTHAALPVRHFLDISGIRLPSGGTFATRFGAQVTDADDKNPNYIISSGDFFTKEPDSGATVAKILQTFGDGNQRPFICGCIKHVM